MLSVRTDSRAPRKFRTPGARHIYWAAVVVASGVLLTVMSGPARSGQDEPLPRAQAELQTPQTESPPADLQSAPPGRLVAGGPGLSVDEISGAAEKKQLRLTITGTFPVGPLDPVVLLNGQPVGHGVPTPDAGALQVILPDVTTGTVVAYRYGEGAPVVVGTLTEEAR